MGRCGVRDKNLEGQAVVDFAKRMKMAVINTYFQKREEHKVTYNSGGRSTQIDYILCRRGIWEIRDCNVVAGKSVDKQHQMVVCKKIMERRKIGSVKTEQKIKKKWWKTKERRML